MPKSNSTTALTEAEAKRMIADSYALADQIARLLQGKPLAVANMAMWRLILPMIEEDFGKDARRSLEELLNGFATAAAASKEQSKYLHMIIEKGYDEAVSYRRKSRSAVR